MELKVGDVVQIIKTGAGAGYGIVSIIQDGEVYLVVHKFYKTWWWKARLRKIDSDALVLIRMRDPWIDLNCKYGGTNE